MQTIRIICIGNLKENYLKDAIIEYSKRLKVYCNLEIIEIPEYKLSKSPSKLTIEKALENEAEKTLEKINKSDYNIALCIEGKQFSSLDFSKVFETTSVNGFSTINFIIGSSFGLSEMIKEKSDLKLSLSSMTFSHQITRVLMCEQIYRAFNILSGGKYHK